MIFDNFIFDIQKRISIIKRSNIKKIIDISLKNYELYNNYFSSLQNKLENVKISKKLDIINFLNAHSTFLFDGLLSNIIINNYIVSSMTLRILYDFYYKYLFILYNDEDIATIFDDFSIIHNHNYIKNYNSLFNSNIINRSIDTEYSKIISKYEINKKNINDEEWINISLKKLGYNKSKGLKGIIEWLINNNYENESTYFKYKESCDYIHSGIGFMYKNQEIDEMIESDKIKEVYSSILAEMNYIIYSMIQNFMIVYNEYSDLSVCDKMKKNIDIILKECRSE